MRWIKFKQCLHILTVTSNGASFEQGGGALWLEADDGETFQGTVDGDGVIAIHYDYCQNGETDMQLVFAP